MLFYWQETVEWWIGVKEIFGPMKYCLLRGSGQTVQFDRTAGLGLEAQSVLNTRSPNEVNPMANDLKCQCGAVLARDGHIKCHAQGCGRLTEIPDWMVTPMALPDFLNAEDEELSGQVARRLVQAILAKLKSGDIEQRGVVSVDFRNLYRSGPSVDFPENLFRWEGKDIPPVFLVAAAKAKETLRKSGWNVRLVNRIGGGYLDNSGKWCLDVSRLGDKEIDARYPRSWRWDFRANQRKEFMFGLKLTLVPVALTVVFLLSWLKGGPGWLTGTLAALDLLAVSSFPIPGLTEMELNRPTLQVEVELPTLMLPRDSGEAPSGEAA